MNEEVGRIVDINLISVPPNRIREDQGDMEGLYLEIQRAGRLYQPVVVSCLPNGRYEVLDGGRRLTCCKKLGWTHVPVVPLAEADELTRLEIEYSMGETHRSFTWQERVKAELKLHQAKIRKYGQALRGRIGGGGWGLKDTATVFHLSEPTVSQDLLLAEGIKKYPELAREPTRAAALRKLQKLMDGTEVSNTVVQKIQEDLGKNYINGNAYRFSTTMEAGSVSLILTDITNYQDITRLGPYLKQMLSPTGQAFLFMSNENVFPIIQALRDQQLMVSSTPYILMLKGESEQYVNYIWVAKNLAEPPKDLKKVESAKNDSTRCHHLDRPVVFLQKLIGMCEGEGLILDPFAYSGSTYIAATNSNRPCICFVEDELIYKAGLARLTKFLMPSLRGEVAETPKEIVNDSSVSGS